MIAQSLVDEVRRLLSEGKLSQRKIAQATGVSRGTVGAIASGRRRDRPVVTASDEDGCDEPVGPPERCDGCGALVYLPCRLCRMRKLLAVRPIARLPERPIEPLGLDLRDDHRARYEQVRARCMEAGEQPGDCPDFPGGKMGRSPSQTPV